MVLKNKKMDSQKNSNAILISLILDKVISQLMKNGKKSKAEKIFKKVFIKLFIKGFSPVDVLFLAVLNTKPILEVRNVRLRGKSFQVPFPLHSSRQISLALKTILQFSKTKQKIEDSLVEEIISSSLGRSQSVKHVTSVHKLASQNRVFSHYRWF
jgi:small subunit ribosomal protein S7